MQIAGIVITFLKYVPIIIGILASISLILSAFNFAEGSYAWGVLNLVLGLAGASMILRMIKGHLDYSKKPIMAEPAEPRSVSAAA